MLNEVRRALERTLKRLVDEDGSLFDCPIDDGNEHYERKLHEVCINHRLAVHLERELVTARDQGTDLYIDIEFNRKGPEIKSTTVRDTQRLVRPDIIVHNRQSGESGRNVLVVECKKADSSKAKIRDDADRIIALMEDPEFAYMYGLQIIYEKGVVKGTLFRRDGSKIIKESIHYPAKA